MGKWGVLVTWFGLFLSSNSTDSCLVTKIGLWRMCLWFEMLKPTLLLCCVVQNNNLLLINLVWWWVALRRISEEPNETVDENPIIESSDSQYSEWVLRFVSSSGNTNNIRKLLLLTPPFCFCYILQYIFFWFLVTSSNTI
jgi:hypothetical protein